MPDDLNHWWRGGLPLAAPIVRAVFRVRLDGIDNLPASGAAILAFNHQSFLDGPLLAIVTARYRRRQLRFLVAAEIFGVPVIGWILRRYEQIPIHRGERDANALEEAVATVREGAVAAMAPEGRVNDAPLQGLNRIRTGLARVALPTGSPVIPVGIWGTYRRWPKSGLSYRALWRRPSVGISYGPAVVPRGSVERQQDIDRLTDEVGQALATQVGLAMTLSDA